ncbi:hypothetical protein CEXT_124561 [Caerostris extrusa]|uniref:Uncharacterized protein n=1 Tax=Caerostris extrusa TaxID=172846 RepID=A0AAV4XIU4_CAEEX|nr:hypothetical protein CEXT_124561 [Caerostris extrusa]
MTGHNFDTASCHVEVKGDKYSICRLTFGSCPSEATNRKPSDTRSISDGSHPSSHRRLMQAFSEMSQNLIGFLSFPLSLSLALFPLPTTSRQEI